MQAIFCSEVILAINPIMNSGIARKINTNILPFRKFHAILGKRRAEIVAKYRQLADLLRSDAAKILKEGGVRLPTEMEIASSYGISRQTVRNALKVLEDEGVIEKRQGSGSYINPQKQSGDMKQIAVVTTFIDDYIFPTILHDAQRIFAENGYSTLIYATENSVGREHEILTELLGKSISAVLIEGSRTALPTPNSALFSAFRKREIPLLFLHGLYPNLHDFPSVLDDNFSGGYQLTEYLIGKGHSRIAGVFKSDDMQGPLRYHGVVSAMTDAGIEINDSCFCWYDSEDRKAIISGKGVERLERFISRRLENVSAVVCYNDEIAYTMVRLLLEIGIRIPEDIAVVSFDNSFYSQIGAVPITSLGHSVPKSGKAAAEMLVGMLNGKNADSMLLKWELISRASG